MLQNFSDDPYSLAENGALAAAPGAPNFALRVLPMKSGNAEFIKFSPGKGEAWQLRENEWNRIGEAGAVPAGDYDIVMAEAANNAYYAFRLDRTTGRTWFLQENRWNENKEKK